LSSKVIFLLILALMAGCGSEEEEKKEVDPVRTHFLNQAYSPDLLIEIKPVSYSPYLWKGKESYSELDEEYGDSTLRMIFALNRVDRAHARLNDTLVFPDTIVNDFNYYAPFPYVLQKAADIPRILFISQTIQAFAAYEYGLLVRWGPTSSGKRTTPTPNGLFHTNWKSKERISTVDEEWLLRWAFNIQSKEGISIHQYAMPGYPASHACARLLEEDAMWIYNWAEQWILSPDGKNILAYGTPVIIWGNYKFGSRKPWRKLLDDPDAAKFTEIDLNEILAPYSKVILERQEHRDSLIAARVSLNNN
jgi:hypothetical protein